MLAGPRRAFDLVGDLLAMAERLVGLGVPQRYQVSEELVRDLVANEAA